MMGQGGGMKLTIRPLTPDLWAALEDLFGENSAVGGCWCMYWRIGRAIRENPLGRIDDGIKISAALKEVRFAMDSPLEGTGFEPSIPQRAQVCRTLCRAFTRS
jgi:hypothetical protein